MKVVATMHKGRWWSTPTPPEVKVCPECCALVAADGDGEDRHRRFHGNDTVEIEVDATAPLRKPGILEIEQYSVRWARSITDGEAYVEIVQWAEDDSHCWTLAHWVKHKEGVDLKFVGDRPLGVEAEVLMRLVRAGHPVAMENWGAQRNG